MPNFKKNVLDLLWIILCFAIQFLLITLIWGISSALLGLLFKSAINPSSEGSLTVIFLTRIASFTILPFYFFVSYKISLWLSEKLKTWKVWEIQQPKKLFLISLLLIILFIFVIPLIKGEL